MTPDAANSPVKPCGGHKSDRRIFALSDPHLSTSGVKPMHVFGPAWDNHAERIRDAWTAAVGDEDIVLVPGDISWAMRLADARSDLEWLAALPGQKVLLRGNHDYWWSSLKKLEALAIPTLHYVQNNHVVIGNAAIGGSRMWDFPGIWWRYVSNRDNDDVAPDKRDAVKAPRDEDPEKIRARELERLRLSLSGLPNGPDYYRVALTHFPPLGEDGKPTAITGLIGEFAIDLCVFGHVHALMDPAAPGADTVIGGTRYVLAASDHLRHIPVRLR